ncbi:MAG TPA: hypothetical protein VJN96_00255 [Vicinamibacterales bacterium]|nr:hypothetical protein [Vicinamibacterales bacterium]
MAWNEFSKQQDFPMYAELRPKAAWRYLTLERFAWLLENKKLWLARGDLLGDPHEGTLTRAQVEAFLKADREKPASKFANETQRQADLFLLVVKIRASFYANCWIMLEHESNAMWHLYCGSHEGVAIKTTMGQLRDSIPNQYPVVRVQYTEDIPPTLDPFLLAGRKRLVFDYEREARILFFGDLPSDSPIVEHPTSVPDHHEIEWAAAEHVNEIRIHPNADGQFFNKVIGLLGPLAPSLAAKTRRSEIAESPFAGFSALWQKSEEQ